MTEIAQYLIKSREKRADLVKTAEKYIKRRILKSTNSEIYEQSQTLGPTAKKFKEYETHVNNRLKKIFNPAYDSTPFKRSCQYKSKDSLARVYSNHFAEINIKKNKGQVQKLRSRISNPSSMQQHQKSGSFDIKCLFTPVLFNSPYRKSRIDSRNS